MKWNVPILIRRGISSLIMLGLMSGFAMADESIAHSGVFQEVESTFVSLAPSLLVISKIVGTIMIVTGLFFAIARQSITLLIPSLIGGSLLCSMGSVMRAIGLLEADINASASLNDGPDLSFIYVCFAFAFIVFFLLGSVALKYYKRRVHRPYVLYWKLRLLDSLRYSRERAFDQALRLEVEEIDADKQLTHARKTIDKIEKSLASIKHFYHEYEYDLAQNFRINYCRDKKGDEFLGFVLEPFYEVLDQVPADLDSARKQFDKPMDYDKALSEMVKSL